LLEANNVRLITNPETMKKSSTPRYPWSKSAKPANRSP